MSEPDEPEPPADPPNGTPQPAAADSVKLASANVPEGFDTARAFISYASADSSIADAVCRTLEREGVKCWIAPRDVTPGELYAGNIVHAIDTTRVVVLVLSQHAADSGHVLREVERASSKRHPIVSFRIDLTPLPDDFAYFLNTSQWLDASVTGIDRALPRLVDAVKGALGKTAAVARVAQNPPVKAKASRRPIHILLPLAVIVAGVLTYFVADRFWLSKRDDTQTALAEATPASPANSSGAPPTPAKSIAVLPFADMSAEKNQEYMSDGIAEELLNLLSKVPDLKVIARSSSFAFKGQNVDIAEIARRLNVAHVLEGSVRTSANGMRITVQLVRTTDSTHVWSERYDRSTDDVFKVQDEIANAVVQALQIKLMGGSLSRHEGGTENLDAYQLYVKAKAAQNEQTQASIDVAEQYLMEALKLDSNFGRAWSKLASVIYDKGALGYLNTQEMYTRVQEYSERALQVSPNIAEAHAHLQAIYAQRDFDWVASQREGDKALAIDPNDPTVLTYGATIADLFGRREEAERLQKAAIARDPENLFLLENLASIYDRAGRYSEAEVIKRSVLERQPNRPWVYVGLGRSLLNQGKPAAALAMSEKEPDAGAKLAWQPIFLYAAGRETEADEAFEKQIHYWATEYPTGIARTYAYRGDNNRALEWLERAYRQKDLALLGIVDDPLFGSLPKDPRFKTFVRDKLKVSRAVNKSSRLELRDLRVARGSGSAREMEGLRGDPANTM